MLTSSDPICRGSSGMAASTCRPFTQRSAALSSVAEIVKTGRREADTFPLNTARGAPVPVTVRPWLLILAPLAAVFAGCGAVEPQPEQDTRTPDPHPKVAHFVAYSARTLTREGPGSELASFDVSIGRRLPPWVLGADNCAPPRAAEGACTLYRCFPDWTRPRYAEVYASAGVVRVRSSGGIELSMEPFSKNRSYVPWSHESRAFVPGELLRLETTGHDIASFTATTTFPGAVSWTAPAPGAETPRSAGLQLSWEPPDSAVEVSIFAEHEGARPGCGGDDPCISVAHCSFSEGKGARVPASILSDFAATAARVVVQPANVTRQRIGEYDVRFVALGEYAERYMQLR